MAERRRSAADRDGAGAGSAGGVLLPSSRQLTITQTLARTDYARTAPTAPTSAAAVAFALAAVVAAASHTTGHYVIQSHTLTHTLNKNRS